MTDGTARRGWTESKATLLYDLADRIRARGAVLADVEAITALLGNIEQHDFGMVLVEATKSQRACAPACDPEQDVRLLSRATCWSAKATWTLDGRRA